MTNYTKKRFRYLSGLLFVIGLLVFMLVAYFLIQSVRETFYQSRFESKYEFISLEEDGEVDPVQVFHGVKVNTFVQDEEDSDKKTGNIIFEVKDVPEAKLKGFKVHSDPKGMGAFTDAIQYKVMVEKETGKESFIVAMKTSPQSEMINSKPAKYRTYSVNENGIIKKNNFTLNTKSKMETQWIRGLSGKKHGYYTNLPYQKGGGLTLMATAILGILLVIGGIWFRRKAKMIESGQAA
ncbi:hypothetical protein ACIGEL_19195 [Rossellomorea aquimaris]|uniref:hypothetical protein n=1 Tax=Rossellomorea aquimaris TaxID=189382 RepID=UPI0037C9D770